MGPEFNSCSGKDSLPTITSGTGRVSVQFVPESRWQPIATAPKDGTPVLLWMPLAPEPHVTVGYLDYEQWYDYWPIDSFRFVPAAPTYWQPLPEPPK